MKRFMVAVAVFFFAVCAYAEIKVTEKQMEAFLIRGSYIKIVVWSEGSKSVSYYNKQSAFEIYLGSNGEVYLYDENGQRVRNFRLENREDAKLDADNNLILTYRY